MFWSKKTVAKLPEELLKKAIEQKSFLIIGGTSGIGKALAISCLSRGASVTIVGRRQPEEALAKATFIQKDLELMKNAIELASQVDSSKFDIVVFTNGILPTSERKETAEGIEKDMAISYLSRYAFCKEASSSFGSNRNDKSVKPRVFVMGYPSENMSADIDDFNSEKSYKMLPAHFKTVVSNEALIYYLAKNNNINAFGLNPGLIKTEIRTNALGKGFFMNMLEGLISLTNQTAESFAENELIHLMVSPDIENISGSSFGRGRVFLKANKFLTAENQNLIFTRSDELLEKAKKA